MEIVLDKRAVHQIEASAKEAILEGDSETLREDILEAFSEEQVEEIEKRLDGGDFYEFVTELLDEWAGDDVGELFDLMEVHLADASIELKIEKRRAGAVADDDEEEEDEVDDLDDEDEDEEDEEEEIEEDVE